MPFPKTSHFLFFRQAALELYATDGSYSMTPFFAAGYVFSTAVFDNLLVLSYFSRGVIRFTETMLGLEPNFKVLL
jgi:hypothetical protein